MGVELALGLSHQPSPHTVVRQSLGVLYSSPARPVMLGSEGHSMQVASLVGVHCDWALPTPHVCGLLQGLHVDRPLCVDGMVL